MATLSEALYALSAEQLRALIEARHVDLKKLAQLSSKRQLVQILAPELSRPASVVAAIQQCNARELRLLQHLLLSEPEVVLPWKNVLETTGGPALSDALTRVVARLEALGLAFRLEGGVFVPNAVRTQIPASLSDRYTLTKCLNSYDATAIRRICQKLGLRPESGSKEGQMEAIRAHLLQSAPELRLNTPLTEAERDALNYLREAGGAASVLDIASATQSGRAEDFYRYGWQDRWKQGQERNAVDSLLARGLVYVASYGFAYSLFLVIPGDLLRALNKGEEADYWAAPPPAPAPPDEPPPISARHTTLIRDVVVLLAFLTTQEAARTNTGHIHKSSLKNLSRLLSMPNERYAAFLYAVAREADLIAPQGPKMIYTPTPRGHSWLHWEPVTQVRALFQNWRDSALWGEMYDEPLRKSNDYRPTEMVREMRTVTLNILKEGVPDTFYSLETLTDTLTFRYPLMMAQAARMGGDLVSSPVEFTAGLVGECALWLGLTELGGKRIELPPEEAIALRGKAKSSEKEAAPQSAVAIIAYRLTPLGAHLLGMTEESPPAEEQEDQFILQANAEIFVPPYLAPATLYRLLTLAEPPSKAAAGNTVCLTRESMRRALDQGITGREMLAFLQAHSRTGIPQNVEYLINEVGGKHGHIHIGKAEMYLQVDSPILLQELQARRELKPYFVRALSDTVALLRGDDTDKLLRELRKAGYLPIADDAARPPALPSQSRHVPPKTTEPAAEAKTTRRAVKVETTLDWERIAKEDGQPWNKTVPAAAPRRPAAPAVPQSAGTSNLVRNPELIKFMIGQASRTRQCVEIGYQAAGEAMATPRTIEPSQVSGNFVKAFCRDSQKQENLPLDQIEWARLLNESF